MEKVIADWIAEAAEELGMEVETRAYSGRGMMGRETVGLVMDGWPEFVKAVTEAAIQHADEGYKIQAWLDDLRHDNMGLQMVFY